MSTKRICAWHKKYFGFELVMEEGTEPATHGICPDCLRIEEAKLEERKRMDNLEQAIARAEGREE